MKLGIRAALIVAFVFASGAPLAVFWLWPHSAALVNKVDEVHERHLLLAKNLGSALETYHRDIVAVFGAFAPKIATGEADDAKNIFTNLHFRHICVVDPTSGRVIKSYLDNIYKCPPQVPAERMRLFRDLGSRNGVTLSNVFAPEGEDPRIYLVQSAGDLLVVGAIRTTFFQELQKRISFGRKGHAAIVDGAGRVLAHPLEDWVQRAADISKVSAVQRMLAGESGVETFYSPALKGDMIAGFTAVQGSGWGVMVPQPLAELEESAQSINRDAFLVLSAGLVFSCMIALLVSYQVARRIGRVESAVTRVAEGESQVNVDDDRTIIEYRELSNLRQGFNRMVMQIEDARNSASVRTSELEVAVQMLQKEIDDREGAEVALQESEKRFRNLFDSEPIAIREEDFSKIKAEIDSTGIKTDEEFINFINNNPEFVRLCANNVLIVDANIAAIELYGFDSKNELLNSSNDYTDEKNSSIFKDICVAIFKGEALVEFETSVIPANEPERIVMARWSVAAGHEKTYGRVLFTAVDITERRLSEERLKQAQKMEAVGQLTGGVAHDFNNLLALIAGNTELISDDPGSDPALTEAIMLAVKRGSELTQRLLAFSRQQPLRPRVIELGQLVSQMSELLSRALGEIIQLDFREAPNLWNALADPGQVESAILNLAINARDAMPNGGKLTIECANARLDDAKLNADSDVVTGDFCLLSVTDDGSGMSAEVMKHAFEPFFTTKDVGQGTGLGLSMVYGFAKQSGGHVSIYSEEGRGTTVRLYLPRAYETVEAPTSSIEESIIPRGRGETVLVIEDDTEVRNLAVKILKKLGYRVRDVADTSGARKVLEANEPVDIVLSDVILPGGMTGMEFAEEMRAAHIGLKFIFMSGYSAEAAVRNGFLRPETILLNKPFETRLLATTLRDQLDQTADG